MFCYQKHFSCPTLPVDEVQFYALVRASQWKETIEEFRRTGEQSLKRRLPAFIFQANFDESLSKNGMRGRWRKQSATRLTGLCVMDVDHVDDPGAVFGRWMRDLPQAAEGEWLREQGVLLVYVTPSGRGLKVVFKASVARGNLIDNQHYMAERLGVRADEACKDASRMSFICREEDILYLDKELFVYENREYGERFDEEYRNGKSGATAKSAVAESASESAPAVASGEVDGAVGVGQLPLSYKGVEYGRIVAKWWELNGGVPVEGERNVKLYQLASSLRAICDGSVDVVMSVVPRLGLEESEVRGIVVSACKEKPKGVSRRMREVLQALGVAERSDRREAIDSCLCRWGDALEGLSDEFVVLKDVFRGLRRNQYPAALVTAGGLLMTLMTRCHYFFYHRPEERRRLNCSALVIGDPASGKSFATRLYRLLSAPIVFADRKGIEAINAYRDEVRVKGANKEKPKRPKVAVRVHPSRTSNAQFIQDMVNSVEMVDGEEVQLHMLTFDTELDNTLSLQRGGAWIDKNSMELKAFHNEEDGQAYSNADSVMQTFSVTWNYIYTGTPIALRKKVTEANFGSGLATRLTVVPLPSTNFEMLVREARPDTRSDERLKEWAWRLDRMKGELPLGRVVDALYEWTSAKMEDAREDESRADEMLLKRVAYHALNFAAPFIVMRHWNEVVADGDRCVCRFETDETDLALCRLLFNMQFTCQRHFFGHLAEKYFQTADDESRSVVVKTRKTEVAFAQLPDEFTVADVVRCYGMKNEVSARVRIHHMMADNIIRKKEKGGGGVKSVYEKIGMVTS